LGPNAVPAEWGRLATFFVLAGRKDDHFVSAVLAEIAGDCRGLPSNVTCQRHVDDIYVLYNSDEELAAVRAALDIAG